MISENDNNKQRNSGRSQSSSPLGVKKIKEQIEKGMKEGLEKGMGYKGAFKNIRKSKPVKDLEEEILKRAEEEKKRMEYKGVADYKTKKSLKEEFKDDQVRIKDVSARQAAAIEHKKKAEKEVNKRLEEMNAMQGSKIKRKIASKAAGKATSEIAYRIAQKMAERAEGGGINSMIIISMTLFIALWIDVIDILMEVGLAAAIVSFIGAIPGAAIGLLIWLANFFLSLIIIFFWMAVLGGGHKKFFWKLLLRLILFVVLVEAVPIVDLLPWTLFTVFWNTYDFIKNKEKARRDLVKFPVEFQTTNQINKKYASYL